MKLGYLVCECLDGRRIGDVERHGSHAGISIGSFFEDTLAASRDDDLVAQGVKGFGKAPANAGSTPVMRMVLSVSFIVIVNLELSLVEISDQPRSGGIPAQFLPRLFA